MIDLKTLSLARDAIALDYWRIKFADFQKEISDAILKACLDKFLHGKEVDDFYIQVSRQAGKTETICDTTRIIDLLIPPIIGFPFWTGIFSPTNEQTKTDIDRNDTRMNGVNIELRKNLWDAFELTKLESNAKTIRIGDSKGNERATTFCFSLAPTTSNESKTLHLAIFEESQAIDDEKTKIEANPMLTQTNGLKIYIGTGGYRQCDFKKAIDEGKNVFKFDADRVIKDYNKLYRETGDERYLGYGRYVQKEIDKYGKDSDYIKTQYYLQFITERGNMITRSVLEKCKYVDDIPKNTDSVEVGIDWGKMHDRTVVSVVDYNFRIRDWLVLSGDGYTEQIPAIVEWVENKMGYNVERYKCDSTGNQDTNREILQKLTSARVDGVHMNLQNKSEIYKQFLRSIETTDDDIKLKYPANHKYTPDFEREMLDMEKEYKTVAGYLSCHHPNKSNAFDDFPDSVALAIYNLEQNVPFEPFFI